ncbi:MAG: hypothetical protein ABIP59_21595 [Roseateles sp.]|uniref:hypothetical protein n=1 Tax=Roseateles sp. TaxID=1971397 RepID=UPI0032678B72
MLELHDMPPDVPAGLHLHHVHRSQHLLVCIGNQLAKGAQQGRQALGGSAGFTGFLELPRGGSRVVGLLG